MVRQKKATLRSLFAQLPDDDKILEILLDLTEQPDRTAAVVGAAILEDRLRRTLCRYLPQSMDETAKDDLLFNGENRPLSSFDAYCMNIINAEMRIDLDNIRRIRNGFAHSIIHHSFDQEEIALACRNLWILKQPLSGVDPAMTKYLDVKALYVFAIGLHYWRLIISFPPSSPSLLSGFD